jgi:hypothetical protein
MAAVAIAVLVLGLLFGSWARRGSDRKIIRRDRD